MLVLLAEYNQRNRPKMRHVQLPMQRTAAYPQNDEWPPKLIECQRHDAKIPKLMKGWHLMAELCNHLAAFAR